MHEDIKDGGEIVFEMSDKVERWGNEVGVVGEAVFAHEEKEREVSFDFVPMIFGYVNGG